MRLVASGLSTAGYVTVALTMGLENVLDQSEDFVARFDRERGRDPEMYYLRVSANQEDPERGDGGFAAIIVSSPPIADGVVISTTPCFMGADPASSLSSARCCTGHSAARRIWRENSSVLSAPGYATRAVLLPRHPPISSRPTAARSPRATA